MRSQPMQPNSHFQIKSQTGHATAPTSCGLSAQATQHTTHGLQGDLWLSPEVRLLADAPGVERFVYDGV